MGKARRGLLIFGAAFAAGLVLAPLNRSMARALVADNGLLDGMSREFAFNTLLGLEIALVSIAMTIMSKRPKGRGPTRPNISPRS